MNCTRIMGIAPFETLKKQMDEVSKEIPNIFFESYVGDLEKGVAIAKSRQKQFDVIISRGGTARLLASSTQIPVIEIELSLLDLLRVIKLVELYHNKYAFVGFSNITKQILLLSEILDKEMEIITITDSQELPEIIESLKNDFYSLIIGDRITSKIATDYEMNTILLESGEESIKEAFDQAVFLGKKIKEEQLVNQYDNDIRKQLNYTSYAFDYSGNLIYQSQSTQSRGFNNILSDFIKEFIQQKEVIKTQYFTYYGKIFFVEGRKNNDTIYVMVKDDSSPVELSQIVTHLDKLDEKDNSSVFIGSNQKNIQAAFSSKSNVLILGEKGTGKFKAAKLLAKKIANSKNWLIDFSINFSDETWKSLLNSEKSVFFDVQATFILKGMEHLSEQRLNRLFKFINESQIGNNRWILIFEILKDDKHMARLRQIYDQFDAFIVKLDPIRLRTNELSSMVSLYIYAFNQELNKNILGLEPEAINLIQNYDWPENIKQLKRVIKQLVRITNTSFISKKNTAKKIMEEKKIMSNALGNQLFSESFLLSHSLKEIERQVIEKVVLLHNNNKTEAAKQLNISRSTLWRLLND